MTFLSLPPEEALAAAVQFHLAGGVVTATEWDGLTPDERDILSLARNLPNQAPPSEDEEAAILAAYAEAMS